MKNQQNLNENPAILVTGGAGFIGSRLVKHLSSQGETVVSMYRHRLPEPWEKVFPVCSDLESEELLAAPLRGVHTVIHLAWEKNFIGSLTELNSNPLDTSNHTKNIRVLRNLIKAMEKAGTKRLIFVSAMGANRLAEEPFLAEKYIAEFFIFNSKIEEIIVVRPTVISDLNENRDKFYQTLKHITRFPGFYPLPKWEALTHPIILDDFTHFLHDLVKTKLLQPYQVREFYGKEGYKIEEIFKMVVQKMGRSQLPLGSLIGHVLYPFVDRNPKSDENGVNLRHFLALNNKTNQIPAKNNELENIAVRGGKSFRDMVDQNKAKN